MKGFGGLRKAGAGVAGNEGLGVVMSVGSGVTDLKVDDFVVPSGAGFGAWHLTAVCRELVASPATT